MASSTLSFQRRYKIRNLAVAQGVAQLSQNFQTIGLHLIRVLPFQRPEQILQLTRCHIQIAFPFVRRMPAGFQCDSRRNPGQNRA